MRLAIVGTRKFTNYELFLEKLETHYPLAFDPRYIEIVSGGAKGVDTLAEQFAKNRELKMKVFKPDYSRFGKGAPLVRNGQIVEYADVCVAFIDDESRGTKYTIEKFRNANKKVVIIFFSE